MNATTKFYTAFFIALAIVILVSGYVGYRVGISQVPHVAPIHKHGAFH